MANPEYNKPSKIKSDAIKTVGAWLTEYYHNYPLMVSSSDIVRKNRFNSILNLQIKNSWRDIPILTNEIKEKPTTNEYMESTKLVLGYEALKIARLAQ